jgi:DNA-nicking Smr family endonuclease
LPEFRVYVVGFEPAHVGHGGEGALYVRIKKPGDRRRKTER